jgi:hypothetical protein
MRVRIIKAFTEGWEVFNPGREPEVPNERAIGWLKQGLAERIESAPETAVMPERERAVRTARPVR